VPQVVKGHVLVGMVMVWPKLFSVFFVGEQTIERETAQAGEDQNRNGSD
jgi:hypothetical protein